jgi:hypothetical protein
MTYNASGPTRVDFHHHVLPTNLMTEEIVGALGADSGWIFPEDTPAWTPDVSVAAQ